LIVVALTCAAFRIWLAEHWGSSSNPVLWGKAAKLEPGDAAYWDRLGLYFEWRVKARESGRAVGYLKRAVQSEPSSSEFWMDIADAYAEADETGEARNAYFRAQADDPDSAEVAWRYGSFLLYEGNLRESYEEIQRALLLQPSLAASAISECWQANPDATPLLNEVLPAKAKFYAGAMDFFLSRNLLDPALAVWKRELLLHLPVSIPTALRFVNALIVDNRLAEAERTWNQALKASQWPRDHSNRSSLIFNGGFEHEIVNGGLGWRAIPADGVRYTRDEKVAHSGSRSLRIDFQGQANLDFHNVFQLVPVQPKAHYHFSAYLQTEDISTDQGIRFQIFDPQHPAELEILTPNTTGTNPWMLVTSNFTTGKDTRLVEIALRRVFSWKFDDKIHGTVWVDDVSLSAGGSTLQNNRK
jgi:tetratricopeptide (TPR) repeat protein